MADTARRPGTDEYAEFYHTYVGKVRAGDVLDTLRAQLGDMEALVARITPDRVDHRYAPGKWTAREVIGHMVDTEWIFTFRALHMARADASALPGMDQDAWMRGADFAAQPLPGLVDEWRHLRQAGLRLFASFDDDVLSRRGIASGNLFTVRALLYIIAGHFEHHRGVLRERYLGG